MGEIEIRANGEQVEASEGDRIVLRIPENATTGYRWVVSELPESLELVADEFAPPSTAEPGAGGERRVELLARGSGQGQVVLTLERPWEHEAADRFEALVTVR
jgi:inhibitor of cysteine peptidase